MTTVWSTMMATEALTFRQKQVSTFFGFSPFLFCFLFSAFFFFSHFYEQISNERCERFRLHICITKICFSLWVLLQYYMRYVGHFVCNVFANFNFPIWKIISLVSWCTSNKTLYGINFYRFCLFFFFFSSQIFTIRNWPYCERTRNIREIIHV